MNESNVSPFPKRPRSITLAVAVADNPLREIVLLQALAAICEHPFFSDLSASLKSIVAENINQIYEQRSFEANYPSGQEPYDPNA